MAIRDLTVKERILLHLFDSNRHRDEYEAPATVTQRGIANATGIRVQHVTQYVRPLISEEFVEERTSHVKERPRRQKVYFLTLKGTHRVASLRNSLFDERLPFRTRAGRIEKIPLSQIYREERRGSRLIELLDELESVGHLSEAPEPRPRGIVDFSQDAPSVERFHGRESDIGEVLRALERVPMVVVTGIAGIGKSALGSRICLEFRGKRSIYWRRIRPWDTALALAADIAVFLKSLGRIGLHSYLAGTKPLELGRIARLLESELVDVEALLIFDDAHDASVDAQSLLLILLDVLRPHEGMSCLLLSRGIPGFYSRREVTVEASVHETHLTGLDLESSLALLAEAGISESFMPALVDASGGNPLFLKLLAGAGSHPDGLGWTNLETYISEEIEAVLNEDELACLHLASVYEIPVSRDGLVLGKRGGGRAIVNLRKRGLLDELATGQFSLHDSLRNYFLQDLPLERKKSIVDRAVPYLLQEAERSQEAGEFPRALSYVENAVMIEYDPARRLSGLQRVGELRWLAGDHLGAVEAYRLALSDARESSTRARLRERIASSLTDMGEWDQAGEEIERGLQMLPDEPSLEAGWLLYMRAFIKINRKGDFSGALRDVERVMGWLPSLPLDLSLSGLLALRRGDVHLNDPDRIDLAVAKADFQTATNDLEAAEDWRRLHRPHIALAAVAFRSGEVEEALAQVSQALAVTETSGNVLAHAVALRRRADYLSACKGDHGNAEALYDEAYEVGKLWPSFRYHHYRGLAQLYRRQGRLEEAREALGYCLTRYGALLRPSIRIGDLALMVRLSAESLDLDTADTYLREAETLARQAPSDVATYYLEWARGVLRARRGAWQEAEASFKLALDLETPRGGATADYATFAFQQGELSLDFGRFLAISGSSIQAREVLLEVRDEFRRLGRKSLEEAASETLAAV
ncbi:MAG: hypothetical protein ACE5IJ_07910 [Thermoplasmata archaeon]